MLSLHLSAMKKKPGIDYKNTFIKNIHERTDQPVFSYEDAITQIKRSVIGNSTNYLNSIEKSMDEFFLTNLPRDVIDLEEDHLERSNMKMLMNETNKIEILSQQNIARKFNENDYLAKFKLKDKNNNKILPIVSKSSKKNHTKKFPSSIDLTSQTKVHNTNKALLKLIVNSDGINRLKKRRKSYQDNLINPITLLNTVDLTTPSKNVDRLIFRRTISKIKRSGSKRNSMGKYSSNFKQSTNDANVYSGIESSDMNEDTKKVADQVIHESKAITYKDCFKPRSIMEDFSNTIYKLKSNSKHESTPNTNFVSQIDEKY